MKTISRYIMTLALLITAVGGAWAQGEFSSDPYTSTTEFNSVSVTSSMTLTIKEGVIVTVNSGLTIEDGVTLTLTGGGRLSVYGKSGNWGRDAFYEEGNRIVEATAGGDGQPAIILNDNAKIVIDNGEIFAEGGQGGRGGTDETAGINQPDGAEGNAFSRFPTIDGATLYYKKDFSEWIKYTSGDKTLYRVMKAVPPTFEVTLNDPKTIASFEMPTNDVTVNYELVRDMAVQMTTTVGDGAEGADYRIRLKKKDDKWEPADLTVAQVMGKFKVHDALENKDLTFYGEGAVCAISIYAVDDQDQPTGNAIAFADLVPGRYVAIATAADGTAYDGQTPQSNVLVLFQGYEVTVPSKEFVTYYKDEPLYADPVSSADAVLYTVSSVSTTDGTATLSAAIETAPSSTPLLVFNNSDQDKTFLLIPADAEPNLALTVAPEFIGTLEATTIAASTSTKNNYALNGKAFVWVKNALEVGANKCWLSIGASSARALNIVFDDATGVKEVIGVNEVSDNGWYDLSGRKLQGKPNRKGVYIMNGRKVVVK